MKFLKFYIHNYLMEVFRIDLTYLGLANTPKVSESKYQAGFGVIILHSLKHTYS